MAFSSKTLKVFLGGVFIIYSALTFSSHAYAQTVTLFSNDPDIGRAWSITTDGTHVYVAGIDQANTNRIWRIPVGGGPATRLYQG